MEVRQGEVHLIITKAISRLARNTTIMLEVVRELKSINVEVEFQKENIKTLSGDGELMLTILSSFAQEKSKNISENQKWAIRKKFKRGELMINIIFSLSSAEKESLLVSLVIRFEQIVFII